jgi:PBP1b-binding outer membrane lipoprotein LpoB
MTETIGIKKGVFILKMKQILSLLFVALFIASCGSGDPVADETQMPGWVLSPTADTEEFFYTTGQGESSRQGTALSSAQANATQAMATKLEVKVSALQKLFTEEVQSGTKANYATTFSNASEQLVNKTMNGVTVTRDRAECEQLNPEITVGNVNTRCYVMVRMPVGQARAVLDNALSKDEELYKKFKTSKAFEKLHNKLHEVEN